MLNSQFLLKITRLKMLGLIFALILILSTLVPINAFSATPPQMQDAYRSSEWDDQESGECSVVSSLSLESNGSSSSERIGYQSGVAGPYTLEEFMIHSLKALALAKGVSEEDAVTEQHVIALVAFAIGEGGDIQNRNVFNPLNHGKMPGDNGTLTGDGSSGFVRYDTFDDGVDATARVLNGTHQQRLAAALTDPNTSAEDVMYALSYWYQFKQSGFANDSFWAEASGNREPGGLSQYYDPEAGTTSSTITNDYYQGRVGLVNSTIKNWEGTAGLIVGTEAEEQDTGAVAPSRLTYNPEGSSTGLTDSPGTSTDNGAGAQSDCKVNMDINITAPNIDESKKDTFSTNSDGSKKDLIDPTGVVLHWTAADASRSVDEFISDIQSNTSCDGGCSVQFYVDGSGKVYQLVDPINTKTAHASGYNDCCIGIEIGGRGEADLLGNKVQMQSVINLTAYLVDKFNMQIEPDIFAKKGILSHHAISDNGKTDVGDTYWVTVVGAIQNISKSGSNITPDYLTEEQAGWLRAANIPEKDWENVDYIIEKESDWNPTAENPSTTAYGLAQFLDGTWSTVGCTKNSDPVQQLVCADKYAKQRYKSWEGAVGAWKRQNWW